MMISVLKRALPFVLTLMVGTGLGSIFGFGGSPMNLTSKHKPSRNWQSRHNRDCPSRMASTPVVIKFKPEPTYSDKAYSQQMSGTVRLNVEFKDDGTIGEIETLEGMPYGLTEESREAAKGIAFTPATIDGTPFTTRRVVEFTFPAH
jgi:TonB family protein